MIKTNNLGSAGWKIGSAKRGGVHSFLAITLVICSQSAKCMRPSDKSIGNMINWVGQVKIKIGSMNMKKRELKEWKKRGVRCKSIWRRLRTLGSRKRPRRRMSWRSRRARSNRRWRPQLPREDNSLNRSSRLPISPHNSRRALPPVKWLLPPLIILNEARLWSDL